MKKLYTMVRGNIYSAYTMASRKKTKLGTKKESKSIYHTTKTELTLIESLTLDPFLRENFNGGISKTAS